MAWLGTWKHRHKITIDSSKIDTSDLSHFPVLVSLSTTAGSGNDDVSDIFDELGSDANRKKIAFTKADGTTQLYGEIEKWDDANEQALIWVSRSGWTIDYDADTEFYIYFDSSQSDNTTYIGDIGSRTEVWDSNFKMVQHSVDTTTSTITDSTSNSNDGTKLSANNPLETTLGQIGNAQVYSSDYINCGSDASLKITGALTLEAFVKGTVNSAWHGIISKDRWTAPADRGYVMAITNTNKLRLFLGSDGGVDMEVDSVDNVSNNTWQHLSGTYDGSSVGKVYFNGVQNNSVSSLSSIVGDQAVEIGTMDVGSEKLFFAGTIDEVRISNVARSASWLKATYNAGIDALIKDYAAVETATTRRRAGAMLKFL